MACIPTSRTKRAWRLWRSKCATWALVECFAYTLPSYQSFIRFSQVPKTSSTGLAGWWRRRMKPARSLFSWMARRSMLRSSNAHVGCWKTSLSAFGSNRFQYLVRTRMQQGGHASLAQVQCGCQIRQRLEHEGALVHARMRHGQFGIIDLLVAVKQQVQIERARSI